MVSAQDAHPLATLREFCTARLKGAFSAIHILPFYPWTSDDGFSVVDYREVDQEVWKLGRCFEIIRRI